MKNANCTSYWNLVRLGALPPDRALPAGNISL